MKAFDENWRQLRALAGPLAAIVLFYIVIESLGITCPILFVTGISCAGCGMSRAWLALLSGNLQAAWSWHPLFWVPPVALILWLIRGRIPGRMQSALLWGCCGLFLIVYFCRMLDPADTVVVFTPREGLLLKMVQGVAGFSGLVVAGP